MFRWWREFWKPGLKCSRVGHAVQHLVERRTYRYPSKYGVADACRESRLQCSRCGWPKTPWNIRSRDTIDSLSMPSQDWDTLKADGVLVR